MVRLGGAVVGAALVVLWVAGLNQGATARLAWLDGLAGMAFVAHALSSHPRVASPAPAWILVPGLLLWLLSTAAALAGATPWLAAWSATLGCAYFGVGVGATVAARPGPRCRRVRWGRAARAHPAR